MAIAAGTTMEFTQATEADIDDLIRLQTEYYREDRYVHRAGAAREAWAGLLADGNLGRAWVVESSARIVGYVVVTFGYSLEYLGRDAFLDELYVAEGFRGQGLGHKALAVAEAFCRQVGVRALHLEVERGKSIASNLYRSWGFVQHERALMTKLLESGSRDS